MTQLSTKILNQLNIMVNYPFQNLSIIYNLLKLFLKCAKTTIISTILKCAKHTVLRNKHYK